MIVKKQTIIVIIMTKTINCYLFGQINELYKLNKKYKYDKMIRFYTLSRFLSKIV